MTERAVRRLVTRLRETGSTLDRPRSGRPRVTSPQEDRFIRLSHLRHRFQPANLTAATLPGRQGNRISAQTVRRRLHAHGLRSRFAYRGMLLRPRDVAQGTSGLLCMLAGDCKTGIVFHSRTSRVFV